MPEKDPVTKKYWCDIWRKARDNLPYKPANYEVWTQLEEGTVPLPDFVQGRASGRMLVFSGAVHALMPAKQGREVLLMKIIGLAPSMAWGKVLTAIKDGRQPRDPEVKQRLEKLAGPEGTVMAWDYLNKRGDAKKYREPSVTR